MEISQLFHKLGFLVADWLFKSVVRDVDTQIGISLQLQCTLAMGLKKYLTVIVFGRSDPNTLGRCKEFGSGHPSMEAISR